MLKNLKKYCRKLNKEGRQDLVKKMDFFPETFNLPCEYSLFFEYYRKNPKLIWIMKPVTNKALKYHLFLR